MVHGYFSSNKIGPHRLYFQIAESLNKIGYTVFRTDLSGMGESDGDIEDISFLEHVADVQTIIHHALSSDFCKSARVHLLGHCIGCCTMLKACFDYSKYVESLTLLSPFIPSPQSHMDMLGEENYYAIMNNGFGYRKGVYCCKSFVNAAYVLTEVATNNMLRTLKSNIVFSQQDEFTVINDSINWARHIPLPYQIIVNANHNYIGPIVRTELLDCLIRLFKK